MAKPFYKLKKDDPIYALFNCDWRSIYIPLKVPVLYEGKIWADSCPQQGLDFPKYCIIHTYIPDMNPINLDVSVFGENSISYNGHTYFTDKDEAIAFQKEKAELILEEIQKIVGLHQTTIDELKTLLKS